MYLVIGGTLRMHFRDRPEDVRPGESIDVPKGTEHKPEAHDLDGRSGECQVVLFEKSDVVNTGDGVRNERTVTDPDTI
jgi:mannose-6-phosphate isomerase-like protein (cupin superfamily)